jgi:cell division protein FtsB
MGGDRKPRRRIRLRRRAGVVLVAGLALVAFLYYRPVRAYMHTSAALEQRQAEVRHLAKEKARLRRRLALDESGANLVRDARRLGLVRPDERLFIVKGIDAWRRAHRAARDPSR